MKKLIIALAVVVSTVGYASAHNTKVNGTSTSLVATTHCYVMRDAAMYVCTGASTQDLTPMKASVTLANGTTISTKGEVVTKSGTKTILKSGQCIDLNGVVADHAKVN